MVRHSKNDVSCELQIPKQEYIRRTVQFTAVELYWYEKIYQDCQQNLMNIMKTLLESKLFFIFCCKK
jgi:hypothetical protein